MEERSARPAGSSSDPAPGDLPADAWIGARATPDRPSVATAPGRADRAVESDSTDALGDVVDAADGDADWRGGTNRHFDSHDGFDDGYEDIDNPERLGADDADHDDHDDVGRYGDGFRGDAEFRDGDEPGDGDGDGDGAPAEAGELSRLGRHSAARRLLLALTALASLVILIVTAAGWLVVTFYERRIDRETIAPPADITVTRPPPAPVGAETWLLVGSDVRTGSDAAKAGGARSDTMMIAHLASDGRTHVVSIPRDLRVPIPAWTDEDGDRHRARSDKINSAFNAGGPPLLVATLEQVAGLRIDHYAELDFGGFQRMTSAIGGIDVCLLSSSYAESHRLDNGRVVRSTNLKDPSSGFSGQAGMNHLVGDNALAFVRQRHGFADGDLSRIHRQQAFLAAMFRKVLSENVLLNPSRLASFLNAVTASAVLDEETSLAELRALAARMREMTTGAVSFSTVPITGQVSQPVFYFRYDADEIRQFFRDITGDTTPFEPSDEPTPPTEPLELGASLGPATPRASGAAEGSGDSVPGPARGTSAPPVPSEATPTPTPSVEPSDPVTLPGTTVQPQNPVTPGTTPAPTRSPNGANTGGWPQPWPTSLAGRTTAARPASWIYASPSASRPTLPASGSAAGQPSPPATLTSPSASVSDPAEAPMTAAAACIY